MLDDKIIEQNQGNPGADEPKTLKVKVGGEEVEVSTEDLVAYKKDKAAWTIGEERNMSQAKAAKEQARKEVEELTAKKSEAEKLLAEAKVAFENASKTPTSKLAKEVAAKLVEDGVLDKDQANEWLKQKGYVKSLDLDDLEALIDKKAEEKIAALLSKQTEQQAAQKLLDAVGSIQDKVALDKEATMSLIVHFLKTGEADDPRRAAELVEEKLTLKKPTKKKDDEPTEVITFGE